MIRLTEKDFAKDSGSLILHQNSVDETYPMHCHSFYEFFLVTGGYALHTVNGTGQIVSRGSLVFVRPDDVHCYDYYKSQDFSFYNSGISDENYKKLCAYYGSTVKLLDEPAVPKHIHLSDSRTYHLEEQLTLLQNSKADAMQQVKYLRLLSEIMYYMLTETRHSDERNLPEWLLNTVNEMAKTENFIIGLPKLLQIANYSQEYVNREFKKYLNTTPTRYINDLRLKHAYQLIAQTDIPLVEISETCGFHNLSHFYSRFKEYHNCSPNAVRKRR